MFETKTVFIVGAGASAEAGLPTGYELKKLIKSRLSIEYRDHYLSSGDAVIVGAIELHLANIGESDLSLYLDKCRLVANAMKFTSSIDTFLDKLQGDEVIELCSKLAIVQSILERERQSLLFFDDSMEVTPLNDERLEKTWYVSFFDLLTARCHKDRIDNLFRNVSIITFNYDRCIEHFLFHTIQISYGVGPDVARSVMQNLEIHHPYGVVGSLPWQSDEDHTPYGGTKTGSELLSLVERIKTFTEQVEEEVTVNRMRQLVGEARFVVYLGFGFHQQNLELLKPNEPRNPKIVIGTTKGVSKSDSPRIKSRLRNDLSANPAPNINVFLNSLKCHELFGEHRFRLMDA